jgi:hypothetical protein
LDFPVVEIHIPPDHACPTRFRSTRGSLQLPNAGCREQPDTLCRFGWREQYGNNLGRKPSQVIPNNRKSVLLNIFRINCVRLFYAT